MAGVSIVEIFRKIAVSVFILIIAYNFPNPAEADSTSFGAAVLVNPNFPAPSEWQNQGGSSLLIKSIDSDGRMTGSYINRHAGYPQCQNTEFPLTGWVYETSISFTTKWLNSTAKCVSITSWTGTFVNGKILSKWYLVINGMPDIDKFYSGTGEFELVP